MGVDNLFHAKGGEPIVRFMGIDGADAGFATQVHDTTQYRIGGLFVGSQWGVASGAFINLSDPFPDLNAYSKRASVSGLSPQFTAVAGQSHLNVGVYGETEDSSVAPAGFVAGVLGAANTQPGVMGFSRSGDAVLGATFQGVGVRGLSFFGPAVHGLSGGSGPPVPNLPTIPGTVGIAGVVGTSNLLPGVIGTSDTLVGVYGFSNNVGVVGHSTNPASFAGLFVGNVNVTGTLTAAVKNAVVAFPDGTRRLLHCMESPEHWFEDFGAARLKGGRAVIKLDADFAKVIKRGDYHVFLTPKADCGGLYVRRQGGASFEVRELGGGKSSVAFSYRIVGRRRDIKAHQRFARANMRLPLPVAKPRKPTAAAERAFVVGLQKEARARARKHVTRSRRAGTLPEHFRSLMAPSPQRHGAKKK